MNKMARIFPIYYQGKRINIPNMPENRNTTTSDAVNYLDYFQKVLDIMEEERNMRIIARRNQLKEGFDSEYTPR